jgi:hypothetical protein
MNLVMLSCALLVREKWAAKQLGEFVGRGREVELWASSVNAKFDAFLDETKTLE